MLRALVEYYADPPRAHPRRRRAWRSVESSSHALEQAVAYVAGMTDRFACRSAVTLLDWPIDQLPNGIDR